MMTPFNLPDKHVASLFLAFQLPPFQVRGLASFPLISCQDESGEGGRGLKGGLTRNKYYYMM